MEPEEWHDELKCCVCEEHVGIRGTETCEQCFEPFHWTRCGGWTYNNRRLCDNCRDPEDAA